MKYHSGGVDYEPQMLNPLQKHQIALFLLPLETGTVEHGLYVYMSVQGVWKGGICHQKVIHIWVNTQMQFGADVLNKGTHKFDKVNWGEIPS